MQVPPFVQLKKDHKSLVGNDKYEGFCVDLLKALEEQFGFKFHIFTASEKSSGRKSTTNWPSERLVGELLREVSPSTYYSNSQSERRFHVPITARKELFRFHTRPLLSFVLG